MNIMLYRILSLFLIISGTHTAFGGDFLRCSHNTAYEIQRDIRSINWDGVFKDSERMNHARIVVEFNDVSIDSGPTFDRDVSSHFVCRIYNRPDGSEVDKFIELRTIGYSARFSLELMKCKEGVDINGYKIDPSLIRKVNSIPNPLPKLWQYLFDKKKSDTAKGDWYFFDDGDYRRFIYIELNSVTGCFAVQLQDCNEYDILRRKALDEAYEKFKDSEVYKSGDTYEVEHWLLVNKQLKIQSPMQIKTYP